MKKLLVLTSVISALAVTANATLAAFCQGTVHGTKSGLAVHERAKTSSGILGTLANGEEVIIFEKRGIWYKVGGGRKNMPIKVGCRPKFLTTNCGN